MSVAVLLLLRGDQLVQPLPAEDAAAVRWRALAAALSRCLAVLPSLSPPLEPVPAALLTKHVSEPRLVARLTGDAAAT